MTERSCTLGSCTTERWCTTDGLGRGGKRVGRARSACTCGGRDDLNRSATPRKPPSAARAKRSCARMRLARAEGPAHPLPAPPKAFRSAPLGRATAAPCRSGLRSLRSLPTIVDATDSVAMSKSRSSCHRSERPTRNILLNRRTRGCGRRGWVETSCGLAGSRLEFSSAESERVGPGRALDPGLACRQRRAPIHG